MRAVNQYRPKPIELPPDGITDSKIKASAAKYAALRAEERATADRYAALQETRTKAMQADRQALADAKRAGKPDLGYEAVTQADAAIGEARRELEALEVAVDDQQRELVATVEKHRDAWAARINDQTVEARAKYAAAVDAMAQAHTDLADTLSLRGWLDAFPEHSRWRPTLVKVASMCAPNGDPAQFDALLVGLREHASPPQPSVPQVVGEVGGVPPLQTTPDHPAPRREKNRETLGRVSR
jgi:hypothetical protein